ncbi:MAG: urease accessory protein UreE [Clostridium sp.]
MLAESILGKINDEKFKDFNIDYVDIEWHEAFKKIHKKKTHSGVEIGIKLGDYILKRGLNDGDVLAINGNSIIVVNIPETMALVVDVEDNHLIPKVCYEIGNRHATLFSGENHNQFITIYDEPMKEMLEKLGAKVEAKKVKFDFDKRISASINNHHH